MKKYVLRKGKTYRLVGFGECSPIKIGIDVWKTAQSKAKALALYKREISAYWGYPPRAIDLTLSDIEEVA